MLKRTREESGEESHCKVKTKDEFDCKAPSTLSFSELESLGKRRCESQSPLSMQVEKCDRTEKPVVFRDTGHEHRHHHRCTHSASYSDWDVDTASTSQEWKSDELMDERTGKTVLCPQRGAHAFQSRVPREHKRFILVKEKITIELRNPLSVLNEK